MIVANKVDHNKDSQNGQKHCSKKSAAGYLKLRNKCHFFLYYFLFSISYSISYSYSYSISYSISIFYLLFYFYFLFSYFLFSIFYFLFSIFLYYFLQYFLYQVILVFLFTKQEIKNLHRLTQFHGMQYFLQQISFFNQHYVFPKFLCDL